MILLNNVCRIYSLQITLFFSYRLKTAEKKSIRIEETWSWFVFHLWITTYHPTSIHVTMLRVTAWTTIKVWVLNRRARVTMKMQYAFRQKFLLLPNELLTSRRKKNKQIFYSRIVSSNYLFLKKLKPNFWNIESNTIIYLNAVRCILTIRETSHGILWRGKYIVIFFVYIFYFILVGITKIIILSFHFSNRISDKLVDELIDEIAKELEMQDVIQKMYLLEFKEF